MRASRMAAQALRAALMGLFVKRACPLRTPARYNAPMRRRGRMFKATKWAMTLLSVAVLALFLASGWWSFEAKGEFGEATYYAVCEQGSLFLRSERWVIGNEWLTFEFDVEQHAWGWPDLSRYRELWTDGFGESGRGMFPPTKLVKLPLCLVLLAVLLLAVLLWWLDRKKYPPGHCPRCGYNLTGNESGVCPECGRAVEASRAGEGTRRASSAAK